MRRRHLLTLLKSPPLLRLEVLVELTFDNAVTVPIQYGLFAGAMDMTFSVFGTSTKVGLFSAGVTEYAFEVKAGGVVDIIENNIAVASSVLTLSADTEYELLVWINADLKAEYWTRDPAGILTLQYTGTTVSASQDIFAEIQNTGATAENRCERFAIGATRNDAPALLTVPSAYDSGYDSGFGTAFRNFYT